jgi:hypothetical protein
MHERHLQGAFRVVLGKCGDDFFPHTSPPSPTGISAANPALRMPQLK